MVLGETGVNFGAGMSGGIAYIYDKNNTFEGKCNKTMVEVQKIKLSNDSDQNNVFDKNTLLEKDDLRIKLMLKRHINYTNSPKAREILDNFDSNISKFYKVFPLDFKNALEQSIKSKLEKKEKLV